MKNAQLLRVLKVGAVQDPQILQPQRVFQSNEPQNTRSTGVFQSIEPRNTPSTSSIESDHTRNTPSTSNIPEYRALQYPEYTKYLKYFIFDTRYLTPRYSKHLSGPSYIDIHRLAFAQDDPIRHTRRSMTVINTAVLRADTSRAAYTFRVTTAAAVSIILVCEIKLVRHRFHFIILPARSSDLCSDTSI